jgi:hypothetical protein
LADKYKLDMSSAANLNHVNKAIARGVEVNVFEQPKGAGGKVKLIKKVGSIPDRLDLGLVKLTCCLFHRAPPRTRRTLPLLLLLPLLRRLPLLLPRRQLLLQLLLLRRRPLPR